jgi:hypothetical protein
VTPAAALPFRQWVCIFNENSEVNNNVRKITKKNAFVKYFYSKMEYISMPVYNSSWHRDIIIVTI